MAGEFRFTRVVSIFRDGLQVLLHGNANAPMKATSILAAPIKEFDVDVPIGAEVTLWAWSATDDFAAIVIEADGFGFIAWKTDAPTLTDGTNNTPLGTSIAWMKKAISNFMPETFQINQAIVNTVAATLVSTSFAGAGNAETGRIYQINFKNPASATASVRVHCIISK